MPDRPTKVELLEAIRQFLNEDLLPELDGVRRFHARVAVNALGILAREVELEGPSLERRHGWLQEILGDRGERPGATGELSQDVDRLEGQLIERIRAGDADASPFREQVLTYLRNSVSERLAINNPTYR